MGLNKVVDFSTANLLKEKGFDIPTKQRYWVAKVDSDKSTSLQTDCTLHNWNNYDDSSTIYYSAPTIAETVMWLYDKYDIWIGCTQLKGKKIFDCDVEGETITKMFNSPTKAYEAAIIHCLNELLK